LLTQTTNLGVGSSNLPGYSFYCEATMQLMLTIAGGVALGTGSGGRRFS